MGVVLAVGLTVAACGNDDETESPASSQPAGTQAPSVTSPNTTAIVPADVNVATNKLGEILVDADGMTLYMYLFDAPGVSTCVDACAATWLPLLATAVTVGEGLDASAFSLIARPDSTQQLAMNDAPLYRFAGDLEEGDTAGQGFNNLWFVVSPSGQPIGAERDG
jgi:predicted lipoprotein with Yx(FWY)xxD motif